MIRMLTVRSPWIFLVLSLFFVNPCAKAQAQTAGQGIKDPKDRGKKSALTKAAESISFEKVLMGLPGTERTNGGGNFSVRLKNSQKVLTLPKRYVLNINTDVGVVVRDIESQTGLSSSATPKNRDTSLIRDKSVMFSLELKF